MEFMRQMGEGSASQTWIDKNLPVCPFCKTEPLWEVSTEGGQLALERWVFRCPNCKVVLSTPADITISTAAPRATVMGKTVAKNLRVEGVERSKDEDFVGEEFPLAELQEWASED